MVGSAVREDCDSESFNLVVCDECDVLVHVNAGSGINAVCADAAFFDSPVYEIVAFHFWGSNWGWFARAEAFAPFFCGAKIFATIWLDSEGIGFLVPLSLDGCIGVNFNVVVTVEFARIDFPFDEIKMRACCFADVVGFAFANANIGIVSLIIVGTAVRIYRYGISINKADFA